jgi:hypothetical protein
MFYGTVLYSLMHCPEAEALLKGAEAGATAAASGQLSNSCCQLSASATAAASGQPQQHTPFTFNMSTSDAASHHIQYRNTVLYCIVLKSLQMVKTNVVAKTCCELQ